MKQGINQPDGKAKDYVYQWDQQQRHNTTQAMYPRSVMTQYCHEQGVSYPCYIRANLVW